MTPRTLAFLAAATAISVAAAGLAVSREPGFMTTARGAIVFSRLDARINDVAGIEIRTDNRTMTMSLGDAGWTLTESGGYAVRPEVVKNAIIGIAGLTYVEPKTRLSDNYGKLDLRDPVIKGSRSRVVRLFARNGDLLAETILGKARYNLPGPITEGVYIRNPGDAQTWLAAGQPNISRLPADWLQRKIVNIKPERMKSAEIRHPDGEVVRVSKSLPSDRGFSLADIPDGKQLKYDSDPANIATVLEDFELDDVRPLSGISFPTEKTTTAQFLTFDGLNIAITMITRKVDGADLPEYWVKVSASSADGSSERDTEARDINMHTSPWAFRIPAYKATRLNKRLPELLKDRKPTG